MAQAPSSTICLINFDNGNYDITGNATVNNFSVVRSTDQTKFGNYSAYFSKDSSSYLSVTLPSEAKTISFWFYCTASNASEYYPTLFSSAAYSDAGGTYTHVDDGSYSTYPVYRANSSSASGNNGTYGSTAITRNEWHHFAYCIDGASHYYFLDGVLQATVAQASPNTLDSIYFGGLKGASSMISGCYYTGYIDEILICSDILYTSDFTPPTEAYTVENEVDAPVEIEASSNYGTYAGNIMNLTDGDTSTYWWTDSAQSASQFVAFTFSKPIIFNGLTAQTLNNTGDCISSGTVLQVSTDGSTWTTVGNFTGEAECTFSDLNEKNVVAVRIYVETASNKWLCVNEITLDYIEQTDRLYLKVNGAWTAISTVYQKVNGVWIIKNDLSTLFDENSKYVKCN